MTNEQLDKISSWLGKPCTCESIAPTKHNSGGVYWGSCLMHGDSCGEPIPWDSSNGKMADLLDMIIAKGYTLDMDINKQGVLLHVWQEERYIGCINKPTLPEAAAGAVLMIIGKEEKV